MSNVTLKEIADELRITRQTAWRLIALKKVFPNAFRVGEKGVYRVPREDLDAYKEKMRVGGKNHV